MTLQQITRKYTAIIVVCAAGFAAFSLCGDINRRMFGQFLTIASYMAVVITAYARLTCPRARISKAFRRAFLRNDFRLLSAMLHNRQTIIYLLCGTGALCCLLGAIAQIYGNQVAEKPILFHIGAPLVCVVLFWSIIHPSKTQNSGNDTED